MRMERGDYCNCTSGLRCRLYLFTDGPHHSLSTRWCSKRAHVSVVLPTSYLYVSWVHKPHNSLFFFVPSYLFDVFHQLQRKHSSVCDWLPEYISNRAEKERSPLLEMNPVGQSCTWCQLQLRVRRPIGVPCGAQEQTCGKIPGNRLKTLC